VAHRPVRVRAGDALQRGERRGAVAAEPAERLGGRLAHRGVRVRERRIQRGHETRDGHADCRQHVERGGRVPPQLAVPRRERREIRALGAVHDFPRPAPPPGERERHLDGLRGTRVAALEPGEDLLEARDPGPGDALDVLQLPQGRDRRVADGDEHVAERRTKRVALRQVERRLGHGVDHRLAAPHQLRESGPREPGSSRR
jgi:hypothetical protein